MSTPGPLRLLAPALEEARQAAWSLVSARARRDEAIRAARRAGHPYSQIARAVGIGKTRVRTIVKEEQ